ncbi:hypothetical protein [Stappia sp. TSB10GB4]|uniref:hypothetical protein n=1 Tax=Stappia sp. TSB10GB4 TaxID=2003584 RepID=UPI0016471CB2|nr:hypothetical protein [Stappia sp. TSB10GB4]
MTGSQPTKTTAGDGLEAARARIAHQRAHPPGREREEAAAAGPSGPRIFRRGPWELLATVLIGLGVVMLMQPFALALFTYSFVTILTGTVMFIIVSHFPE